MDKKPWYKSKTIWTAIVTVAVVVYNSVTVALGAQCGVEGSFCVTIPVIPEFVYAILGACGIYSRNVVRTTIG